MRAEGCDKRMKTKPPAIFIIMALIFLSPLFSCFFLDDSGNNYQITLFVDCTGGTTSQAFSLNLIVDSYALSANGDGSFSLPLDNIKSMTVTATKLDGAAALQINILKGNKVVQTASLAGNYPSNVAPTNTLTLQWTSVESKNPTKGVPLTGNSNTGTGSGSGTGTGTGSGTGSGTGTGM
jgi:hypothetical protein